MRALYGRVKAIIEEQRRRAAEQDRADAELDRMVRDVDGAGDAIEQAFTTGAGIGASMPAVPVSILV